MTASPALAPPRDLTVPEAGSRTARDALSRALRKSIAELRALPRAVPCPPGDRATRDALLALTDALARTRPDALASVARRVTVGAPLKCLRRSLAPGGDAALAPALLAEVAAQAGFELALAGALPHGLRAARPPASLLSPGARAALDTPAGATAVTFQNGSVTYDLPSGPRTIDLAAAREGAAAYHPIEGDLVLAERDNNPLAMTEAHPDKRGNAIDLGGRGAGEWVASLRAALALVARYLPDLRGEMALYLQQVVPVGYDAERHLSASYAEAVGTIYLTLHPSRMTMTEALIHEFQHNKLNALLDLDPLLENAFWPLYASPVRPDPRPLHGVLLAVHAFVPVARLYEAMLAADAPESRSAAFRERYAAVRRINHEGAAVVLAHGRATPLGRGLLDELARWDAYYAAVQSPLA